MNAQFEEKISAGFLQNVNRLVYVIFCLSISALVIKLIVN